MTADRPTDRPGPYNRAMAPPTTGNGNTKSRLFATAGELFRTKGFAATTTREIAAALGIQKATLYHHIRRKEDLLYELCLDSLEHMNRTADEVLSQDGEPVDRLRNLIAAHVVTALEERDQHATMLTELRSLPDAERAEVVGRRRQYETRIDETIAEAQRAGQIRTCSIGRSSGSDPTAGTRPRSSVVSTRASSSRARRRKARRARRRPHAESRSADQPR
jgi:AcrR family transcriptional regulator